MGVNSNKVKVELLNEKFKEAAAALKAGKSSLSCYNRGNALARAGELKKALAAYDQALALDPKMDDARFNRELVEKLLQQQQQKSEKQQKSKQKRIDCAEECVRKFRARIVGKETYQYTSRNLT